MSDKDRDAEKRNPDEESVNPVDAVDVETVVDDAADDDAPATPWDSLTVEVDDAIDVEVSDDSGDADDGEPSEAPETSGGDRGEETGTDDALGEAERTALSIDGEIASDDKVMFRRSPTLALVHVTVSTRAKGGEPHDILHDVNLEFFTRRTHSVLVSSDEQRMAVVGLLAAMVSPTKGRVMYKSQDLREMSVQGYRGHFLGFIPQRFALRDELSALKNLVMTMDGSGRNFLKPKPRIAEELLLKAGLSEERHTLPVRDLLEVERRRVMVARALCCEPSVVLADEPTGRLGAEASESVLELLLSASRKADRCVIVVTSDESVAARADIQYTL